MKMIGVMSLEEDKKAIRELLEKHGVQIFSEIDIHGHTTATIEKYGWFATKTDVPLYSTLCFAIIPEDHAQAIMDDIAKLYQESQSDHPIRAFQLNVERMV
jgi:nitrogen regulatory protein PII